MLCAEIFLFLLKIKFLAFQLLFFARLNVQINVQKIKNAKMDNVPMKIFPIYFYFYRKYKFYLFRFLQRNCFWKVNGIQYK